MEYTKKILNNGKLASLASGNYISSKPPYGFDKTVIMEGKRRCPTLVENKAQADVVRLIFDLYVNQNMGRHKICNYLEERGVKPPNGEHWVTSSLKDMLQNVHYIGKVKWNWRKQVPVVEDGEVIVTRPKANVGEYLVFEGKHAGIVSEELFQAAQEKLGKNPRVKAKSELRNPFAGVLFCQCGRAMTYQGPSSVYDGIPRVHCPNQKHCKTGSCHFDAFLDKMIEVLEQCIEDFEIRIKNNEGDSIRLHASLVKNLEKRLEELKEKELAQWDAQSDPDPAKRMPQEIFQQLNARLRAEKEEVQQALCQAYDTMPTPIDYEEKVVHFRDVLAKLKDPDVSAARKNALVKTCVERVVYHRETPKRGRVEGNFKARAAWDAPPIELDVTLKV